MSLVFDAFLFFFTTCFHSRRAQFSSFFVRGWNLGGKTKTIEIGERATFQTVVSQRARVQYSAINLSRPTLVRHELPGALVKGEVNRKRQKILT